MSSPIEYGPARERLAVAVTEHGLSDDEAQRRLIRYGPNALPVRKQVTWLGALARQLTDTVIVVLLGAMLLTILMRDYPDCAVIGAVVVLNSILGAAQEVRSSKALDALATLTAPRATVVRNGTARDLPAADIVPGDVMVLSVGDVVAADATVARAEALRLDESMLTGESLPVDRAAGDRVGAGTVVVRGRASAVVDATGLHTEIGRIGRGLAEGSVVLTPLQQRLARLGRLLAAAVTVAAVVVAALNIATGRGVEYSITLGISLAVAAIPESLPAVVALTLALAARRMAKAGVLVRRLAAVEALGSITVLATDKTGTLTTGRLSVTRTWVADELRRRGLLEAAVLCNDANEAGEPAAREDPLEVALVRHAIEGGVDVAAVRSEFPRIAEEPFDAQAARMLTVHRGRDGVTRTIVKGSPEVVLALCGDGVERARETAASWATSGGRVLAVAERVDDDRWRLLGLIEFADSPRKQASRVITALRAAGIRPVMITGDHPGTAAAVANAVGIADGADDEGGARSVYARVRPDEKTDVVHALRSAGELVAMTGDGVNDAPALRASDVGVAMGERGTEVARQAADLVLTSDDLGAMVVAVAEGRRAYDNLRRFLHYAMSGGLAEILVMLVGPALGLPVPLGPGQILWVNLLTHGLPGVAIGNEPARSDVLNRPPRPPRQGLVDRILAVRIGVLGTVIAAATLGAAVWAHEDDRPWRAVAFVTLTMAQLGAALALRPTWRNTNPALLAAVAVNLALIVAAVRWSPLEELLRTDALGGADLLRCALAAAPAIAVAAIWGRRSSRTSSRSPRALRHWGTKRAT